MTITYTYKKLFIIELAILVIVSMLTYFLSSNINFFDYIAITMSYMDFDTFNKTISVIFMISILIVIMTINRIFIFLNRLKRYKDLSLIDDLTNLFNRRHIEKLLNQYMNRENRYDISFSIILLDLDYFKTINDTYGHIEGDYVLKTLSHFLQSNVRNSDIVGRWGGEEFIILCPNTNLENTKALANKLRIEISELNINSHIKITASFGVAQYDKAIDKMNINYFINRVDEALYKAKNNGRNKIESV